jgi:hypothetical protein
VEVTSLVNTLVIVEGFGFFLGVERGERLRRKG